MVEGPREDVKRMDEPTADRPSPLVGTVSVSWTASYLLRLPEGPPPSESGYPTLVCLHGFGEDAAELDRRLAAFDDAPYARLFLDGPFPVETKRDGAAAIGRSWYAYDGDQPRFLKSLAFAEAHLVRAYEEASRAAPLDPSRTALFGYSQGGYLASVAAFRARERYRALVAVACRVKTEALEDDLRAAEGYPALLVHGRRDEHTPLARQEEAHRKLLGRGVASELLVHEGGHGIKRATLPTIDAFVRKALGP
jgi:predicted esterase